VPSRAVIVAAIGGLVIGHMLWLLAISLAINTGEVSFWVLITSAVIAVAAALVGYFGWRAYQRRDQVWTAFLWSVPVAPVLFTLVVLGVTYL
jgi:H+/Cl- antiporter ClcA